MKTTLNLMMKLHPRNILFDAKCEVVTTGNQSPLFYPKVKTLSLAVHYIFTDMMTSERYRMAYTLYYTTYQRSAALVGWIKHVSFTSGPVHSGAKQPRIGTKVQGHLLVRSLVRSHRSLIR